MLSDQMMSGEAGNIPGLDSILRGEIMRKDALVNQLLNQNKEVHTEILAHLGIPSSPDPSLGRSMCSAHISHWMVWGWYVWLEHSCSCSLEAFLFAKKSKESIQDVWNLPFIFLLASRGGIPDSIQIFRPLF